MHHIKELAVLLDTAQGIVERTTANANDEVKRITENSTKFAVRLSSLTASFAATGIAEWNNHTDGGYIYPFWLRWGHRSTFSPYTYFRNVAKELKRPFVYLGDGNRLTIERRRYTEPLYSAFLLVQGRYEPGNGYVGGPMVDTNCSRHTFTFYSDDAKEMLQAWRKQCATDPAFRRALRLV